MYTVKKYILGLLRHNISYFLAISLHREFRFSDILLPAPLAYR